MNCINFFMKQIWDYLAWIVLFLILVWLILKIVGVIHTPLWLEYSPLLGAVYIAGWAMNKLDRATEDIKELRNDSKRIDSDVGIIKNSCPRQNKQNVC